MALAQQGSQRENCILDHHSVAILAQIYYMHVIKHAAFIALPWAVSFQIIKVTVMSVIQDGWAFVCNYAKVWKSRSRYPFCVFTG